MRFTKQSWIILCADLFWVISCCPEGSSIVIVAIALFNMIRLLHLRAIPACWRSILRWHVIQNICS